MHGLLHARQVLCHRATASANIWLQKIANICRLGGFYREHSHLLPGLYGISLLSIFMALLDTPQSNHQSIFSDVLSLNSWPSCLPSAGTAAVVTQLHPAFLFLFSQIAFQGKIKDQEHRASLQPPYPWTVRLQHMLTDQEMGGKFFTVHARTIWWVLTDVQTPTKHKLLPTSGYALLPHPSKPPPHMVPVGVGIWGCPTDGRGQGL